MSASPAVNAWLRCYRPRPEAWLRLVCLPHAGGSATFFRPWLADLPAGVELVCVQYPGRGDRLREPCATDLVAMAGEIGAALLARRDRPVALFGHSLGAAVALEVARFTQQRPGSRLRALFVSGRSAPAHPGSRHRDPDDVLWQELDRLGGTSPGLVGQDQLRSIMLPALRADYRLSELYRPSPRPAVRAPIVVCLGDQDPEASPEDAEPGWRPVAGAGLDLTVYPGNHFYLRPQQARVVAGVCRRLALSPVERPSGP